MRAAIRGTEIYFDIAGMELTPNHEVRPIIFMLHGGPGGDHSRYKLHSLELQDIAQLVFIDHRGCGLSSKTNPAEYTLENNIEDIEALRKYLGLGQICILGTSYGGMVAQGYAIRYPKNLNKLILVATAPSFRFIAEAKSYLKKKGSPAQIEIAKHLWEGTFKDENHVAEFFTQMESLYTINPKGFNIPKTNVKWSHEALNLGFGGFLKDFNFIPDLPKIKCSTLILAGEDDWICRPEQAIIMSERIPLAELKIFKNCGHSVAIDAHDQYIEAIKQFLS